MYRQIVHSVSLQSSLCVQSHSWKIGSRKIFFLGVIGEAKVRIEGKIEFGSQPSSKTRKLDVFSEEVRKKKKKIGGAEEGEEGAEGVEAAADGEKPAAEGDKKEADDKKPADKKSPEEKK